MLKLLIFPDKRLNTVATPIESITPDIKKLAEDMLAGMYKFGGVGLAATQINIHKQLIVLDISNGRNSPIFMINPTIIARSGEVTSVEACLSLPGASGRVKRAKNVSVEYLDLDGNKSSLEASGVLAVAVQHEIDHLLGKTIYDYQSRLKKDIIRRKVARTVDRLNRAVRI